MDVFTTITYQALPAAVACLVAWTVYGIVYRLYLSPISSFPGSKLSALTYWYEFYYDIYPHYGQYTFHIRDLHEKYGPIIRINPYELHISTPQFYETLYSSNKKRDKWYWFTKMFGVDDSTFATVDHNIHRMRRGALNSFFSVASVRRLQPMIEERVQTLLGRLREFKKTGEVMKMSPVTSAYSNGRFWSDCCGGGQNFARVTIKTDRNTDVIMMYTFGRTYNRLEAPDFDAANHEANHEAGKMGTLIRHEVWILRIILALPESILQRLGPALAGQMELKNGMRKQIIEILNEKPSTHSDLEHPAIFHELLNSNLPPEEKTVERLADEARVIVGAGQETVAWVLTVITCHLLSNPTVLRTLKTELATTEPDPDVSIPDATLANLPYFSAVIKEGLRLGYGVCTHLARVPHEPLVFSTGDREWVIPPGTPVGMTSALIHHDESIFPNSKEFRPERWIEDPRLDRYLVSFSKGSRACLGMNLAYAEMHLWLSGIFRRYGSKEVRFENDEGVLELVDTDISDVEIVADRFVPVVKPESKGVRVRVLP